MLRSRALCLGLLCLGGCFLLRSSHGGGQALSPAAREGARLVEPADVAVPQGYRVEAVATGLTFPDGVAVDDDGSVYVVESGYSYGEAFAPARLLRLAPDGGTEELARGDGAPWTGVSATHGVILVSEGGELTGGRVVRFGSDGGAKVLVDHLPSLGDHHTDRAVLGADGWVYFGQGTASNSGVVGPDDAQFGWLPRHPDFHDVACRDLILTGANYRSPDVLGDGGPVDTGAYQPFGTATVPGQVVRGQVPCGGAVMRVPLAGGKPEVVAWGLRNPFGLAFAPDGSLYVTENGFDVRGSRPIFGAPDVLWRVQPGAWYGWPDFTAGERVDQDGHGAPGKPTPRLLLAHDPGPVPRPAAVLGVHASADGLAFSRSPAFGFVGQAFVAEFGDMAPVVGKTWKPVGYRVVRVDPATGVIHTFAANGGPNLGPASQVGGGGLERPVAAAFSPSGDALYVADFGIMAVGPHGPAPKRATGVIWRITRSAGP